MAELECMYSNRGQQRDMISSHTLQQTKPDKSRKGGRQHSTKLFKTLQKISANSTKIYKISSEIYKTPAHKATHITQGGGRICM